MNTQRKVVYGERAKILEGLDLHEEALEMVQDVVLENVHQYVGEQSFSEEWDLDGLVTALSALYPTGLDKAKLEEPENVVEVEQMALEDALAVYEEKERALGPDENTGEPILRELERMVLLSITDNEWRSHLYEMDYLQEGIGLRSYGQKDPLVEFQREGYSMFESMKQSIRDEFVRYIYRIELVRQDEPARPRPQRVVNQHGDQPAGAAQSSSAGDKIPRNAPCPCGSGRKYKKCHGLSA
jgi:preprotein translocase subunit SecA